MMDAGRKETFVAPGRKVFLAESAAFIGVLVVSLGLLPLYSRAQTPGGVTITGGAILGHVRGPGDVDVPGATVQLIETQTGQRKETWTDEAGNYTFIEGSPGGYQLIV